MKLTNNLFFISLFVIINACNSKKADDNVINNNKSLTTPTYEQPNYKPLIKLVQEPQQDLPKNEYYSNMIYTHYSVRGFDENGFVYGEVSVDDIHGYGYIFDEDGNPIYINVRWSGNDTFDGYDEDGNYYDLEID